MRGLLFGVPPEVEASDLPDDLPASQRALALAPMGLRELDDPALPADDWVLLRTRLCGICGSDVKQVLGDGEMDNAMTAVISFPQVLGHEMVGTVEVAGPDAGLAEGTRVVLNPWLTCAPRGIDPVCEACARGDLPLCHRFTQGHLTPGIHVGNSSDAPGGFGQLVPAHRSMCIPVPEDVSDEQAVLADPFAVSLHAILRNPPPSGGTALVYGVGALGTTALAILQALYPDVTTFAVTRYEHQATMASQLGAQPLAHVPETDIVTAVADATGGVVREPFAGTPWLHPGGVDVVYDTVGSPGTLEVGVRITRARGTIAILGVATPARFEWTPWYFKELRLVGSNAFGIEELDGERKHAIAHYLDLVRDGRVDLRGMLTHTVALDDWRRGFELLADQGASRAIKVAIDHR